MRVTTLEPVKQILAEFLFRMAVSRSRWVAARTRTSTARLASPPNRWMQLLLQDAQELACVLAFRSPISSRKRVPPLACSKRPIRRAWAPGECAPFMTEEFALQQRIGNGRAIDGDKRLVRPLAVLINGAGDRVPCPCRSPRG